MRATENEWIVWALSRVRHALPLRRSHNPRILVMVAQSKDNYQRKEAGLQETKPSRAGVMKKNERHAFRRRRMANSNVHQCGV